MLDMIQRKDSVAHDIKGLLTRACLAVEMLERHASEPVRLQAVRISRALDEVATICLRELDTSEQWSFEEQHFDASELRCLLRDVLNVARMNCGQEGNPPRFELQVDPDVDVCCDRSTLYRIILNLTMNAMTAVRKAGGGVVALNVYADKYHIMFDVRDEGPGLPDRILAVLYPASSERPERCGALCTGLITASGLADEMGGQISLERTGETGTTIQLRLPLPGGLESKNIQKGLEPISKAQPALSAATLPNAN